MPSNKVLVLQPPSPACMNVMRDYAGGYGVAFSTSRPEYGHEGGCAPYVSAFYAAAILDKAGYDVTVIDCQAEQLSAPEALFRIKTSDPEVVISPVNLPSIKGDLAFLTAVRDNLPGVRIIAIGTVSKLLYDEILKSDCITAAVRGDVEVVVPVLVPVVIENADLSSIPGIAYRSSGSETLITGEPQAMKDLNDLPMLPYQKLPMDRYWEPSWGPSVRYMSILDGRGCPYPCQNYCPYPFGFGRRALLRDPKLVVDEVQYLHENFETEAFIFRNQTFTMNKKHAEGICEEILRRDLHVRWLCETRLDAVETDILKLMKSAGCERIHYGLESGDPEMFNKVGKPGCDLARFGQMVEETRRIGIVAKLNVILGLPGESWQTIRSTIQTIRHLKPDVVMAAIITPYPGTKIFEDAKRQGLLLAREWSEFTGFKPVMRTEHLMPDDLLKAQRMVERCLDTDTLPVKAVRKVYRLAKRTVQRALCSQTA